MAFPPELPRDWFFMPQVLSLCIEVLQSWWLLGGGGACVVGEWTRKEKGMHGMAAIDSNCPVFSGLWLTICVKRYPCADRLHVMSFTT